ncbi:MAG: cation:proton antiporter subunit C [Limnochordia bacterium]|nr:cation:proton antiporter subunit C [Limnochordia bacterium]
MKVSLLSRLLANYPYLAAFILFAIGIYGVIASSNLLRKLLGISIMESAIFLMFIASGNITGRGVPIVDAAKESVGYVNPLPQALILTGIVVGVSTTAFALALLVKLHKYYGTLDARIIYDKREADKH